MQVFEITMECSGRNVQNQEDQEEATERSQFLQLPQNTELELRLGITLHARRI